MSLRSKIVSDPNSADIYEILVDGTEILSIKRLDGFRDEPVELDDLSIELLHKINRIIRDAD